MTPPRREGDRSEWGRNRRPASAADEDQIRASPYLRWCRTRKTAWPARHLRIAKDATVRMKGSPVTAKMAGRYQTAKMTSLTRPAPGPGEAAWHKAARRAGRESVAPRGPGNPQVPAHPFDQRIVGHDRTFLGELQHSDPVTVKGSAKIEHPVELGDQPGPCTMVRRTMARAHRRAETDAAAPPARQRTRRSSARRRHCPPPGIFR